MRFNYIPATLSLLFLAPEKSFSPAPARPSWGRALREWLRFDGLRSRLSDFYWHANDPKIRERHDRQGNVWFDVYDPVSGRSALLNSEAEVRAWLDTRYYR